MINRIRLAFQTLFHPQTAALFEAGLLGLFFIQALRFLVGMIYSRTAGASAVLTVQSIGAAVASGAPDPNIVRSEITLLLYALALPLLALIVGRFRPMILIAAILVAIGRAFMTFNLNVVVGFTPTSAAALTVGAGLLYIALLAYQRFPMLPYFFVIGIGGDQILRAFGNTLDPSWAAEYTTAQAILSATAIILALYAAFRRTGDDEANAARGVGLLPFWGGIGMGALLFLQLSLLALPNAIAGRADSDYTLLTPFVLLATWLPLIPWIRGRARAFIGLFDGGVRGWLWLLLIILLMVFGTRFTGIVAGAALVFAQFTVTMVWWWLARPRADRERRFAGLWVLLGALVFGLLVAADNFTYEYAYVRDFAGNLNFLNNAITPLLRGFRGLGLGVILLAVFLAALPMTQMQRRIPWSGGTSALSLFSILIVGIGTALAAFASSPPVAIAPSTDETIRVATYNIHGGFSEFFEPSLDDMVTTMASSGANVTLIQETDAGRLTSFGVDQPLWLARRLGMDRRFFATNEGLQGIAVLSNIPIAYDDGALFASIGNQTGLQRVQIVPAPDRVITIYNTWLGYLIESNRVPLAEQEQDQQRQLTEMFSIIASHHPNGVLGRTIIGGTFNNVPDSPLIAQMRAAAFDDPFAGLAVELSATLIRSGVSPARFDYLWLRNLDYFGASVITPVTVTDASGNEVYVAADRSDHRLAVVGVQLNRE